MAPRVSVIMATFNQGPFLADALYSALSQTGVDVEVIVIDDASTDNTAEILSRYDGRVKLIRLTENCGGPARPRNMGLKAATGDYIAILDGDDLMLPGRLSEQVAFFEAHPDVSFQCANFRNFNSAAGLGTDDELAGHREFARLKREKVGDRWYRLPRQQAYETLLGDNFIGVATVMFRRSVLTEAGFFDETLKRSEDIEYWYRIARVCTIGYIDAVLAGRRLHSTNISASPAALEAKLEIYRRQLAIPMSAAGRRMVNRMMGKIHFSLGYLDRQKGRRWSAARRFLSSMVCDFNQGRAILSMLALLQPVRKSVSS